MLADFLNKEQRLYLRTLFLDYEITVTACYGWWCDADWKIQKRKCSYSLFVFPVENAIHVHMNRSSFDVKPGEFLMIPENTLHSMEIAKNSDSSEHFTLRCHIHDRWGGSLMERFESPLGTLPEYSSSMQILRGLAAVTLMDPKFIQQRGESFVRELLAWHLIQNGVIFNPRTSGGDARVNVAIEKMKRQYGSPDLSIEQLAHSAKVTSAYLRKIFQRETGTSPKKFLNTLRMRKAAYFLSHTLMNIKEVSAACGFSSTHYFHPAFQKEFGCTPNTYRHRSAHEA